MAPQRLHAGQQDRWLGAQRAGEAPPLMDNRRVAGQLGFGLVAFGALGAFPAFWSHALVGRLLINAVKLFRTTVAKQIQM